MVVDHGSAGASGSEIYSTMQRRRERERERRVLVCVCKERESKYVGIIERESSNEKRLGVGGIEKTGKEREWTKSYLI